YFLQVVADGLGQREERRKRREVAGVEARRIPRLREELLRAGRIVRRRVVGPRELEHARDEPAGGTREPEGLGLIERVAVEAVAGRQAHAAVVRRRTGVPPLGPVAEAHP